MAEAQAAREQGAEKAIQLDYEASIYAYAFSLDGKRVLTGSTDNSVRLWDLETGCCLRVLEGNMNTVWSVAWSADQHRALSGSNDKTVRLFASAETKQRVRELEEQSAIVLDNESKERALVGEVISTVALAGQLSWEFNVSDQGIDMEIEFKSDAGEATRRKLSAANRHPSTMRCVADLSADQQDTHSRSAPGARGGWRFSLRHPFSAGPLVLEIGAASVLRSTVNPAGIR